MNSEKFMVFVDLDGVLVDFDAGVKRITGKLPSEQGPRSMWPRIASSLDFYTNLDWMPDGRELWNCVLGLVESKERVSGPVILTGLPRGGWAEAQKRVWCSRELGEHVEVITCFTSEKAEKAEERSGESTPVLIDDRIKIKESWTQMGGVFVHHRSAEQSIAQLKKLLG